MRAIMVEVVIRLKQVIAYICQNNCAVKDPRIICGFQCLVNNALSVQFSSVQSLSRVRLFATPWTAARQASLSKYLVLYIIYQEIKMLSSFFENIACNYIRSFVYFDLTRISHWISPRENENFKETKLKGFIHLHLVIHHDGWLMRYYKIQTL